MISIVAGSNSIEPEASSARCRIATSCGYRPNLLSGGESRMKEGRQVMDVIRPSFPLLLPNSRLASPIVLLRHPGPRGSTLLLTVPPNDLLFEGNPLCGGGRRILVCTHRCSSNCYETSVGDYCTHTGPDYRIPAVHALRQHSILLPNIDSCLELRG